MRKQDGLGKSEWAKHIRSNRTGHHKGVRSTVRRLVHQKRFDDLSGRTGPGNK